MDTQHCSLLFSHVQWARIRRKCNVMQLKMRKRPVELCINTFSCKWRLFIVSFLFKFEIKFKSNYPSLPQIQTSWNLLGVSQDLWGFFLGHSCCLEGLKHNLRSEGTKTKPFSLVNHQEGQTSQPNGNIQYAPHWKDFFYRNLNMYPEKPS